MNDSNSEDHVFPRFLGGRTTIGGCRDCNSSFGHEFEGEVSQTIAPIMVGLSIFGVKPHRRVIWHGAHTDQEKGLEFNLDTNGNMTLSRPVVDVDGEGRFRRGVFRDAQTAWRHGRSAVAKGLPKQIRVTALDERVEQPPLNSFQLHLGTAVRRLAVKLCVGLVRRLSIDTSFVSNETRGYLLGTQSNPVPVRLSYNSYESLDKLRRPLTHLIYAEGDNDSSRCYGVVQLYGFVQLYVDLHSYYHGVDFAAVGTLDPVSGDERFEYVDRLGLPEAPRYISKEEEAGGPVRWFQKLNLQVQSRFGRSPMVLGFKGAP